ncbi:MAG: hypothetical protein DMF88_01740 [Acidobacteria bacterium]|nr:MAG: hypothetical protein DMF88_01740 [Acidobacteriota bacterium]
MTARKSASPAKPSSSRPNADIEVDATLREIGHEGGIRCDIPLRRDGHMARSISQVELGRVLRLRDVPDAARLDVMKEI